MRPWSLGGGIDVALSEPDARQLAVMLQQLDDGCLELVGAAVDRLKRDQDGRFKTGLEDLHQRRFCSERERLQALLQLIGDGR
jgi:hypothetical protein